MAKSILYIHQYYNSPSMGGSTRSHEFAKRFTNKGYDVLILTIDRTGFQRSDHSDSLFNYKVVWIPIEYDNSFTFIGRSYAFIKFSILSCLYIIKNRPDFILATSTPLTVAIPALFSRFFFKIPYIFEVRDLWPEIPIAVGAIKNRFLIRVLKFLESMAYKHANGVVALSPGMANGILQVCPLCNVVVIPNSCDAMFKDNITIPVRFQELYQNFNGAPSIVYAGAFGKINKVEYLVDLAYELSLIGSSIKIVLFGKGSDTKYLKDKSASLGLLGNSVFIYDPIPKSDMPAIYKLSTAVSSVFDDIPEMQNNSSNKFFDGLAASKPIIINFGGWMHDLITVNNAGISLWGISTSEAAAILDQNLNDHNWIRSASISSGKISRQFDRDLLAKKYLDLLKHS
jgi:glycosyltransferase involved in cell wall biosynthesis